MKRLRVQLTYANVVASLALFLVLAGGTAYATTDLSKDSVGTAQIKDDAVTAAKIRKEAITGAQVRDGSLGSGELSEYFPGEGDEAGVAQVIYGTDANKGTRIYDDVLTIPGALAVKEAPRYGSPASPRPSSRCSHPDRAGNCGGGVTGELEPGDRSDLILRRPTTPTVEPWPSPTSWS